MSGKATGPTFVKPNERLVILADLDLMEFPLEVLYVLHHNKSIASISRDFSLQFFANRYFSQKEGKNPRFLETNRDLFYFNFK